MTHLAPRNHFTTSWNDDPLDQRPMIEGNPHSWRQSRLSYQHRERYVDSGRGRLMSGKYRGCHIDDVPANYLIQMLQVIPPATREYDVVAYHLHKRYGFPYQGGGWLQ